ncbi:hypothetical protein FGG08_001230 [Glutinoglossum americanum]|uniref:Uncharacterized protein n=1 Tax=Glutinoglossum americanum TaxID=1670608 RepID=A0A9P8IDT1_9PEZI|nr:hypothetical protein FGG08_001230 [Glutinoglossum americanum]
MSSSPSPSAVEQASTKPRLSAEEAARYAKLVRDCGVEFECELGENAGPATPSQQPAYQLANARLAGIDEDYDVTDDDEEEEKEEEKGESGPTDLAASDEEDEGEEDEGRDEDWFSDLVRDGASDAPQLRLDSPTIKDESKSQSPPPAPAGPKKRARQEDDEVVEPLSDGQGTYSPPHKPSRYSSSKATNTFYTDPSPSRPAKKPRLTKKDVRAAGRYFSQRTNWEDFFVYVLTELDEEVSMDKDADWYRQAIGGIFEDLAAQLGRAEKGKGRVGKEDSPS